MADTKDIVYAIIAIVVFVLFVFICIKIDIGNSPTNDDRCRGGHDF